jgi:hypothetical protein
LEDLRGTDHSEDLGVDGWMDNIKMNVVEIGIDDVDWIHLTQVRDRWRAFVKTVMNVHVP